MINGKATKDVNLRSQPKVADGNVVGLLKSGDVFTGAELVSETTTRKWIRLLTVNGGSVRERYVAAWVVDYEDKPDTPPVADDPIVGGVLTLASGETVKMVVVK